MTNLKQGTLDTCRKAQRGGVCSVDQELGRGGELSFFSSTQLARLCSCCCRYSDPCQHDELRARSVFTDQNLAAAGGYTQSTQLIQVVQEPTPEGDSVTDGQCAVQQFCV